MKNLILLLLLICVAGYVGAATAGEFSSSRSSGRWLMAGTIAGHPNPTQYRRAVVLDHHYLHIHEVSREKKANREPQYEAMVFIRLE